MKLIYETITGSRAYGMDITEEMLKETELEVNVSDEDRKGIFLPKVEELFSLADVEETICLHEPEDREYHALRKFLKLASLRQNPTVLEMLFTEKRFIKHYDEVMDLVMGIRDTFLTKNCYWTFSGYAKSLLMRIRISKGKATREDLENHMKYVLENILRESPQKYRTFETAEKGFVKVEDVTLLENDKYTVEISMGVNKGSFEETFGLVNELNNTLKNYNKLKHRNKKENEAKLWKHAAHLVKLVKQGIEILKGEGLQTYRHKDREELLDIRLGKMSWDLFFKYTDELFKELDEWKDKSKLPEKVDIEKVNGVYRKIMLDYVRNARGV